MKEAIKRCSIVGIGIISQLVIYLLFYKQLFWQQSLYFLILI